jgi:signal transduction histidine kinase
VWSFRDITRERELEVEMRHAQKMEAVGRLAGGVAHDFNNLLTVILGSASAVQDTLGQDHVAQPDVADISAAVKRAAELTRQLLTFSRKQAFGSQRVDLNAVLKDMLRMLTRLLGEDVAIDLHCADALGPVNVDRGQLEQVIANLCVNARDAMPAGGRIVLSTRRVPADACPLPMPLGGAELTVTDTGTGITAEGREPMFEPFYTTM